MHRSGAHRDKLVVEYAILSLCREETIKSTIARRTNLSHGQATRWLDALVEGGYLEAVEAGRTTRTKFSEFEERRIRYRNTEKGELRRKQLEQVCSNTEVHDLRNAKRDS